MVSGFGQVQGDFSLTKKSKVSALGKVVATSAKFGGIKDKLAPFSPLSLNPLFAYEAESSMVAPFERPTLDLDPSDPSSLDIITATRAGVATYTDADGVIQSASPNTVRVDHVDGVPMILIEPRATNLLPYSEDFSRGGWNITNGTLTPNYAISPRGVQNRSKINFSAGGEIVRTTNFTAGQSYTFSFYAKVESGTFDFTYGNIDYTLVSGTATTEWQRFEVTQTAPVATRYPKIDAIDTGDLLVWGAQLEAGPVSTSYIPTNGSTVTRNADDLVIDGSDFTDFFNTGGDGTFYAEFVPRDVLGEQWYLLAGQDYNRRFMYSNVSSAILNAYDGTNTASSGQDMVANQLNRAAFTYTATTQQSSLDGSNVPAVPHNGNYLTTSRLYLASPANDRQMNGHIKRLIYWPYHSDDL